MNSSRQFIRRRRRSYYGCLLLTPSSRRAGAVVNTTTTNSNNISKCGSNSKRFLLQRSLSLRHAFSTTTTTTTTTASSLSSRVISRRVWNAHQQHQQQQQRKHPPLGFFPSQTKNKNKSSSSNDEKPWPKSVVYSSYMAAAILIPYFSVWLIATNPTLREKLLFETDSSSSSSSSGSGNKRIILISWIRHHFGTADPDSISYCDATELLDDNAKPDYRFPNEAWSAVERAQERILQEELLSKTLTCRIGLIPKSSNTTAASAAVEAIDANSSEMVECQVPGSTPARPDVLFQLYQQEQQRKRSSSSSSSSGLSSAPPPQQLDTTSTSVAVLFPKNEEEDAAAAVDDDQKSTTASSDTTTTTTTTTTLTSHVNDDGEDDDKETMITADFTATTDFGSNYYNKSNDNNDNNNNKTEKDQKRRNGVRDVVKDPLLSKIYTSSMWQYQDPKMVMKRVGGGAQTKNSDKSKSYSSHDNIEKSRLEFEIARLQTELTSGTSTRAVDDIMEELNDNKAQLRQRTWRKWMPF